MPEIDAASHYAVAFCVAVLRLLPVFIALKALFPNFEVHAQILLTPVATSLASMASHSTYANHK
jgi:hypothetical protein